MMRMMRVVLALLLLTSTAWAQNLLTDQDLANVQTLCVAASTSTNPHVTPAIHASIRSFCAGLMKRLPQTPPPQAPEKGGK
jgi:hypothetical protein